MKKENIIRELSPEELEAEKQKNKRRRHWKTAGRVIDRIFGFILATGIMFGLGGLALEYVLVKGPSPALKETFVMTMLETRRFDFIANVFLSEEEVNEIASKKSINTDKVFDSSLINVNGSQSSDDATSPTEEKPMYPEDEDGDGIILEEVKRKNFAGYMLTVLDPSRVFVGMPDESSGTGYYLSQLVEKYDAIGGINGGGYYDPSGAGNGRYPKGLTIIGGKCYNEGYERSCFAGFDQDNIMHVGYFNLEDVQNTNIRDGVSFDHILVLNGESMTNEASGVNPRTAIGQRADGAVLMLVIDGRQAHSVGCTYRDLADIMIDYGAVNAMNLDGGSSTTMYLNGEYVNSCSAGAGDSRVLPTAFLFK